MLKKYSQKRELKKTPEPLAKKNSSKSLPIFCVQKHAASHLHYDFRLEHKGELLSWAVPKGPSLNPADKRLAVRVEEHPYEYRNFEGVIPEDSYGAGTVMLWDEGTYTIPGATTKKEIEKAVSYGLKKGHLEFELSGEKLKGGFDLVRMHKDDKKWLLIKRKDKYAKTKDITKSDRSVRTDRTMKEITQSAAFALKHAPKTKMPVFIKPMLAKLIDEPFDGNDWIFEVKWDGYRALAFVDKKVKLLSRTNKSFLPLFEPIAEDLAKLKKRAVLDGEVVILDKKGRSDFQAMQNFQRTGEGILVYYVFDLLYLDGKDLRDIPLVERKQLLEELLSDFDFDHVRYSDHVDKKGIAFFKKAAAKGLEGIMAKRKDSPYTSTRSSDWLKIKTHERQEAVIGGFTEPRGSRKKFGALLLGVYDDKKKLTYVGHVGGGFDAALLDELYKKMKPLIQAKCPFSTTPKPNMPVEWIKPKLVCEVSFAEWTTGGRMRQPIFKGLRTDKRSAQVKREKKVKKS
jgi:bifunctional non-homologous end joining protein LigD